MEVSYRRVSERILPVLLNFLKFSILKVLWFSNTPANAVSVLETGTIGGGWLQSLDLAVQDQVELHIVFHYPKVLSSFKVNSTTYHPITPSRNWRMKLVWSMLSPRIVNEGHLDKYLRLIDKIRPDVIHIHGTENSFGSIIRKTNTPTVISIQGIIAVCTQKFFSGVARSNANSSLRMNLKSILSPSFIKIFRMFERMSLRERATLAEAGNIIGRTDWDRRVCSILAPRARYYRCEEILREQFYRNVWQPRNGKFVIHTTNGNSIYKGFETICHSLKLLLDLGLNVEWRVAGIEETDEIVEIARKQVNRNFPSDGLVLLGRIEADKLVEKLLEASIYVMPSHIENSPNNLCEAMILGIPCVATAVGGTPSMMEDGAEGVLVQDGDPWAMAGAILELYRDPERAKFLGRNARQRAILRHKKERIVNDLLGIYSSVIQERE